MVATRERLGELLDALARHLHERIHSPDVTAAEMRIAQDLCKYLGISGERVRSSAMYQLSRALPDVADLSKWRDAPLGIGGRGGKKGER